MAITLMTTTGTTESVREALGLTNTPESTPPSEVGPIQASVETLPSPATPDERPSAETAPAEPEPAAPVAQTAAPEEPVPDSEYDADGEPLTERAARSSRSKLKTIHQLRNRSRTAELEAARLKGELEALRAQLPKTGSVPSSEMPSETPTAAQASADPQEPKEADFQTYEAFIEARADYRARRAVREELETHQRQEAETRQRTAFQDRVKAFVADHPDYDEVLKRVDVPLTPDVAKFLTTRAEGPAIAYTLAKDPERLQRLLGLPADEALEELALIRHELRQGTTAKAEPPPPISPTTAAPPPPRQVRGSSVTTAPSLEDLAKTIQPGTSVAEWMRRRNEQVQRSGPR